MVTFFVVLHERKRSIKSALFLNQVHEIILQSISIVFRVRVFQVFRENGQSLKNKRLELERPVLDAFWCWLEKLNVLKGSALFKAITYAKNQKPYLENYLLDGRCALSNNAAENAIRPFTVGRKNWLFSDTPKGASASAAVYSIVETAKANGLNVFTYSTGRM